MDNRFDAMEQRMTSLETLIEQTRQLVLEQQARPQVTMEQIRQLIQERPTGQRRPRQEDYVDDDEGEGSDRSTLSRASRHRHRRRDTGNGPRFFGSRRKLDIPVFKGEDAYGWLVRIE